MKKSAIALFFAAFLTMTALAQNVQEGVSHLNAERYASARSVFERMLAANPNNMEATYWLGQTLLEENNTAGARSLYEKALATNGNAPLMLAAIGGVELAEGKRAEARQRFEAAINGARGKKGVDPNVLLAIGRANVSAYSESKPYGDLDYAIARLNEAAQQSNNPEIFLALGNAYRKKHQGSEAAQAYRKAGNYAPALYRSAMLYKTQTSYRQPDTWGAVVENLNSAIAADQRFAPAYEELYYYNLLSKQDFPTAETFASKYISAADPSPENLYLKAQTEFVQKKYPDAITTAKNILQQTNNAARPRVYRLLAYSYLNAKDTATACQYTSEYFAKVKEEDLRGEDYILRANACAKGDFNVIRENIIRAVQMDSVLSRQVLLLNEAAKDAKTAGQRVLEAEYNVMSYRLRGTQVTPTELINDIALPYFFGGAYLKADSAAQAYVAIAPDSIYGHYWSALARERIDTAMTQGLAMPAYEKVLQVASTDKVRYRSQGVRAAQTLAIYNFNVKNDKAAALAYATRGLEFDPENANLKRIIEVANAKPQAPAPATKAKTDNTKVKTTPAKTKVKTKG